MMHVNHKTHFKYTYSLGSFILSTPAISQSTSGILIDLLAQKFGILM